MSRVLPTHTSVSGRGVGQLHKVSGLFFVSVEIPITSCVTEVTGGLLEQLPFLWDQLQAASLELISSHV